MANTNIYRSKKLAPRFRSFLNDIKFLIVFKVSDKSLLKRIVFYNVTRGGLRCDMGNLQSCLEPS